MTEKGDVMTAKVSLGAILNKMRVSRFPESSINSIKQTKNAKREFATLGGLNTTKYFLREKVVM
jgi:hypothetical protein